jgi:hypothetical protein
MRQDRRPHQKVVVCKTAAEEPGRTEVLRLPRFALELSCCLQDPPHRGRRAKPVRLNALGPELSCCLQDCRGGVSGPGSAVAAGFFQRRQDCSAGTASRNRDCASAIFGDCPGRPHGIRDRRRVSCGDNRRDDGVGTQFRSRLPGGAGISIPGRPVGNSGNAVHPYEWRCLIPATSPQIGVRNLETAVE